MRSTSFIVVALTAILAGALSAAPLGTGVTYHGLLTDGGVPVTGTVDLRFGLFTVETGGSPLQTVAVSDLAVTDGRVTAVLDFGDQWSGDSRWLQVEVRDGSSTGSYTTLPGRQELLATPMGLYAVDAGHAASADHATAAASAATLDGQTGAFYRAFANLTGVPGGLSDGDDDTAADLGCAAGELPSFTGAGWVCAPEHDAGYLRTAVVGPVGDGSDFAANGAALVAAVHALPTPASPADAWAIEVEPGRYELGPSPLSVPKWSVLRGSGRDLTVIAGAICDTAAGVKATVMLQIASELRDLTVENHCSSASAVSRAVTVPAAASDARIGHVEARATGSGACTAVLSGGAAVVLDRVAADATGCGADASGIASGGSNALLLDCEGVAEGFGVSYGLRLGDRAWVERGIFSGVSTSGAGSSGIFVSATADIRNVITAGLRAGAYLTDQIVTLSRVTTSGGVIEASDQGGNLLLAIEHSRIFGSGVTVIGDTDTAIGIAMSQVYGTVSPSGGLIACAGVWDGSWTPYANTCP